MAYTDPNNRYEIYLSPSVRGTPDNIRVPLLEIVRTSKNVLLGSQQVSDKKVINELARLRSEKSGLVRVLLEADYLKERKPLPAASIWDQQGGREKNRQCLLALLRAGIDVQADQIKGALQHVNMVVSEQQDGSTSFFVTSANMTAESLGLHFNWAIFIKDVPFSQKIESLYRQSFDGDFRDASLREEATFDGERLVCAGGAEGQAVELAVQAIDGANNTINFAYFNISKGSRVEEALKRAAGRGVRVQGIVDGDQQGAGWDAVPDLRRARIDGRYYPGALTGAIGRMHYKMFAVDDALTHLSTANASHSAEESFELGITIQSGHEDNSTQVIQREVSRLMANATVPANQQ